MDNDCEQELQAELFTLIDFYENLRDSLTELLQRDKGAVTSNELQNVLQSTQRHQSTYEKILNQWHQPGFMPSRRCEQLRAKVAGLLAGILEQIKPLEQRAAEARDLLLPKLDRVARDRQAVAAYSQNLDS